MHSRVTRRTQTPPPASIRRIVEPAAVVLLTDLAKEWSRVNGTKDDALLGALIDSATRMAEDFTARAFITQDWQITFDSLPFETFVIPDIPRLIELPRPRLQSVLTISVFKEDDTEVAQTLTDFIIDTNSEPGRIMPKPGFSWPSGLRSIDSVKITYRAGYGAAAAVPETIKTAIKMMVSDSFENRESWVVGATVATIPRTAEILLAPYRIFTL